MGVHGDKSFSSVDATQVLPSNRTFGQLWRTSTGVHCLPKPIKIGLAASGVTVAARITAVSLTVVKFTLGLGALGALGSACTGIGVPFAVVPLVGALVVGVLVWGVSRLAVHLSSNNEERLKQFDEGYGALWQSIKSMLPNNPFKSGDGVRVPKTGILDTPDLTTALSAFVDGAVSVDDNSSRADSGEYF